MNTEADTQHSFLTDPWWSMGEMKAGQCGLCINETATRARAGLLNILSGTTIFLGIRPSDRTKLAWSDVEIVIHVDDALADDKRDELISNHAEA